MISLFVTIRQLNRLQGLVIKANKKEINLQSSFKKLRFEVKNVVYNLSSDKKVTTNKKGTQHGQGTDYQR